MAHAVGGMSQRTEDWIQWIRRKFRDTECNTKCVPPYLLLLLAPEFEEGTQCRSNLGIAFDLHIIPPCYDLAGGIHTLGVLRVWIIP